LNAVSHEARAIYTTSGVDQLVPACGSIPFRKKDDAETHVDNTPTSSDYTRDNFLSRARAPPRHSHNASKL